MKRCFYIANAYDGSYFFVSDNIDEYFGKLAAYVMNLQNSKKMNHYSFGSVEMAHEEYLSHRDDASKLESGQIKKKQEVEEELPSPPPPSSSDEKKPKRGHLQLV